MKVARLTAPSAHHRLESRPSLLAVTVLAESGLADTGSFLSPMVIYGVPVSCSYTLYRYVVKHGLYDVRLSRGKDKESVERARWRQAPAQPAHRDGERAQARRRRGARHADHPQ